MSESGAQYLVMSFGDDDDGDLDLEQLEGGDMVATLGPKAAQPEAPSNDGFYANLAEVIPELILDRVATDLLRRIEQDKEARKDRDKQYEEGIRRTGLGKDAPGGATFEGASKVVHPMLTEACIDYESRIIKELWPIAGPVKKKIVGAPTKEKDEKASRKVDYMNYQLTSVIKEARATMETTLTQVPLGGLQYIRQWQDHRLGRPRWEFIGVDNVYLPAGAQSYYSANRRTYAQHIDEVEFRQRIKQGIYRDAKVPAASADPEASKTAEANAKVEGLDLNTGLNLDGNREIYETLTYLEVTDDIAAVLDVEEEGDLNPYLMTIDVTSKKVLAFYRDWEPDDKAKEPIDHLYEFPFIPWRGAYAIGLPQIIGGLSGAATGALRALLDSAHVANAQGYFVLKGSGTSGQNKRPNPGESLEIDGGMETDDIRKKIMPFASVQPSNVLFELLGFLVEASKGVVRTSMDESAIDTNANTPVGTQLSRVEEGLVVFSSIHGRIHAAMNRLLAGLHRLNRLYMPEFVRIDDNGKEIIAYRSDFDGPMDVQPVSDPTIFSDQQRFAQILGMEQSATAFPQLYNVREIQKEKLRLWKIPDPDRFLAQPPQAHEMNAVNENVAMALGSPVRAFPDQDHLSHLTTHLAFFESPLFGSNPLIAPQFLPPLIGHLVEHFTMLYASTVVTTVTNAAGRRADELFSDDPRVKGALDKLLALTSQHVMPQLQQQLAPFAPALQKAMAMLQQIKQSMQPQQPADPAAMAAVQAAAQETARKAQDDKVQATLAGSKQQSDAALKQQQIQASKDNALVAAQARLASTQLETQSAQQIASDRLEVGQAPKFSDGSSLGGA